jgi:hypothetical protein
MPKRANPERRSDFVPKRCRLSRRKKYIQSSYKYQMVPLIATARARIMEKQFNPIGGHIMGKTRTEDKQPQKKLREKSPTIQATLHAIFAKGGEPVGTTCIAAVKKATGKTLSPALLYMYASRWQCGKFSLHLQGGVRPANRISLVKLRPSQSK